MHNDKSICMHINFNDNFHLCQTAWPSFDIFLPRSASFLLSMYINRMGFVSIIIITYINRSSKLMSHDAIYLFINVVGRNTILQCECLSGYRYCVAVQRDMQHVIIIQHDMFWNEIMRAPCVIFEFGFMSWVGLCLFSAPL